MSDYTKQLQRIIKDYRQAGQTWPASALDIAHWAIRSGKYKLPQQTVENICSRELAQAMREEYIIDLKGTESPRKASG